jgi:hypothetical protein
MSGKTWIDQIFQEAKNDPTLQNTLNIDELLNAANDGVESENFQYIYDTISEQGIPPDIVLDYCNRLFGYSLIEEIHELKIGKYIRWLHRADPDTRLFIGGILNDIVFDDNGITLKLFQLHNRYVIRFKFDKNLVFQKG